MYFVLFITLWDMTKNREILIGASLKKTYSTEILIGFKMKKLLCGNKENLLGRLV